MSLRRKPFGLLLLSVWLPLVSFYQLHIFLSPSHFILPPSSSLFFNTLCLFHSVYLSLHPCLTGRHNSRCLVVVLKTCLLHDGRLLACHPSSFAVVSSLQTLLSSSGLSVWWLYWAKLSLVLSSYPLSMGPGGLGSVSEPNQATPASCHYLILLFAVLKYSVSSLYLFYLSVGCVWCCVSSIY